MDDLIIKGAQKESDPDFDRVDYPETAHKGVEENTKLEKESGSYGETRQENKEREDPKVMEEKARKNNRLRENLQSVTGVLTAVAATAVVSVSVAFAEVPVIQMTEFEVGQNFAQFQADINNETGEELVIQISNDKKVAYKKVLNEGQITEMIKGLDPETSYDFTIRSAGGIKRTFMSKHFKTTKDPTEFEPKVLGLSSKRDGEKLKLKFDIMDVNGYYSNYQLTLKVKDKTKETIQIKDITSRIPVDLKKYGETEYQMELSVNTNMPSDKRKNIKSKVIYQAVLKN